MEFNKYFPPIITQSKLSSEHYKFQLKTSNGLKNSLFFPSILKDLPSPTQKKLSARHSEKTTHVKPRLAYIRQCQPNLMVRLKGHVACGKVVSMKPHRFVPSVLNSPKHIRSKSQLTAQLSSPRLALAVKASEKRIESTRNKSQLPEISELSKQQLEFYVSKTRKIIFNRLNSPRLEQQCASSSNSSQEVLNNLY